MTDYIWATWILGMSKRGIKTTKGQKDGLTN